jgi:hypothetical protein
MSNEQCERASQLQRAQTIIEYGLAVVIPSLFACMLFSYVLMQELFDVFFVLSIIVAATLLIPAKIVSDIHFQCWSKNVMPKKLVNGMLGMIYISEVSVFAASGLSIYRGLNPEHPLTFIIIGGLMLVLLLVLAFNDRYGKTLAEMDKRCLRLSTEKARDKVVEALGTNGNSFEVSTSKNGFLVSLKSDAIRIHINSLGSASSEIILERQAEATESMADKVKAAIVS